VGVIPTDWDVVSLQDLSAFITSGSRGWASHYSDHGALFVRSQNIRDGRLDFMDTQFVTPPQGAEGDRTRLNRNDLLITITGNSVGNVALVEQELGEAYVSQHVGLVRLCDPLAGQYVCRYLASGSAGNEQIFASQSGQSKPGLSLKDLQGFLVAMPSAPEQRAIATALSDVDALLAKLDQLIAKKRDLKQAAMQQLLTGQTRLPGFSGVWKSRRIESFSAFVTKGATPTTYGFNWQNNGIVFLRSECVSAAGLDLKQAAYISELAHKVLIRGEVREGDILITITGNVGRVVLLDEKIDVANINQHISRIRVVDSEISAGFVFHWLSQPSVRHYYSTITTGQAYPQISLKQVRETDVSLGSFAEQTAIATLLSDIDADITALEARRDKTRALKLGMMQVLLTGQIRLG
jgi:type I restriction enzyme, S subunit